METTQNIDKNLDKIDASWFLYHWDEDSDKDVRLTSEENIEELSKIWGVTPIFLKDLNKAFEAFVAELKEELGKDLADIWERLDRIEEK